MRKIEMIGLMSGTSLDGLDIAHVSFEINDSEEVSFELKHHETYNFWDSLNNSLLAINTLTVQQICILDKELGKFYAECVNHFLLKNGINKGDISAIASHGQTILHQPQHGFTLQIGCGTTLAYLTGIDVINDFRSHDIAAGGQGAPLVPVGDFGLLEDRADAFLNIGGFTNVSYKDDQGKIIAFDICPGNLPLNKLANNKGLTYDKDGELSKSGEINFFLLDLLNSLDFYALSGPKSLGNEWLEGYFYPLIKFDKEIENNLRTIVEHEAFQMGQKLNESSAKKTLVTGGGAKNRFLIERIQHYYSGEIVIPDETLIDFKEALIFAYLGALFLLGKPNAISTVTGAQRDMICGVLHKPGY